MIIDSYKLFSILFLIGCIAVPVSCIYFANMTNNIFRIYFLIVFFAMVIKFYLNKNLIQKSYLTDDITLYKTKFTYKEALNHFMNDADFRDSFVESIRSSYDNVYLNIVPVNKNNYDSVMFEYVLINTDAFDGKIANNEPFLDKLENNNDSILSFPNKSNDAILIVPNKLNNDQNMLNISTYMRSKGINKNKLLTTLVSEIEKAIDQGGNVWVLTHGTGVYWLHIRIQHNAKYVMFDNYKISADQH